MDPESVEESLAASRREGVAAQVAGGVLDLYLVPFALFLGAPASDLGVLIALPSFLSALAQFFVVDILHAAGNRRRLLVWGTVLQSLALAPLPALAFFGSRGAVAAAFASVCLFRVVGSVMGPAWGSLMSDYLPESRRGDFFGRRSRLIGLSGIVSATLCGAMLHFLGRSSPAAAFFLLFGAACAARAISLRYMKRMINLPEPSHVGDRFDLSSFRERLRQSNLARFIVYIAGITFAAQLTSAYCSVHLLRDLRYDFMPYTAVQLASAVTAFGAYPLWGRHADIVGNARVLKFNSFLLPLIPILWTLTEKPGGLILIEGASGFLWAGFNLCATNFIYDAVAPERRVRALGYFNLISGAAIFAGGCCGGWLADRLPPVLGYRLHGLFLAAAAARLAAHFALSRNFNETRPSARDAGSAELFFSVVGLHPLGGANDEMEWNPARLPRKA